MVGMCLNDRGVSGVQWRGRLAVVSERRGDSVRGNRETQSCRLHSTVSKLALCHPSRTESLVVHALPGLARVLISVPVSLEVMRDAAVRVSSMVGGTGWGGLGYDGGGMRIL